jgi:uncharacterized protein YodC (DUF2158 family)
MGATWGGAIRMADAFKAGDTVKLKSGGPAMTVIEVDHETAWTAWFVGDEVRRGHFPFVGLAAENEAGAGTIVPGALRPSAQ